MCYESTISESCGVAVPLVNMGRKEPGVEGFVIMCHQSKSHRITKDETAGSKKILAPRSAQEHMLFPRDNSVNQYLYASKTGSGVAHAIQTPLG